MYERTWFLIKNLFDTNLSTTNVNRLVTSSQLVQQTKTTATTK